MRIGGPGDLGDGLRGRGRAHDGQTAAARAAAAPETKIDRVSPTSPTSRSALCEGPIAGIGRIWADGKRARPRRRHHALLSRRRGRRSRQPDRRQGGRGRRAGLSRHAYVVFERLPLERLRQPRCRSSPSRCSGRSTALDDQLCARSTLIPGVDASSATTPDRCTRAGRRRRDRPENVHIAPRRAPTGRSSLDQLQASCAERSSAVSLVVAWFGDDLRCGHCTIQPGVEGADKITEPHDLVRSPALTRGDGASRQRERGQPRLRRHAVRRDPSSARSRI